MLGELKTKSVLPLYSHDAEMAYGALTLTLAFYWPMRRTNKYAKERCQSAVRVMRELREM